MNSEVVRELKDRFDGISQYIPEENIEFWFARDLMKPLGYSRWENFQSVIKKAIESCKTAGGRIDDHFRGVTKMISAGKGAERTINDFMLTRYACYLIAQNGDSRKESIAFAQSYFAIQTRKQEVIEDRIICLFQSRVKFPFLIENAAHDQYQFENELKNRSLFLFHFIYGYGFIFSLPIYRYERFHHYRKQSR